MICKCFLPVCDMSFQFLNSVNLFNFNEVQFMVLFLKKWWLSPGSSLRPGSSQFTSASWVKQGFLMLYFSVAALTYLCPPGLVRMKKTWLFGTNPWNSLFYCSPAHFPEASHFYLFEFVLFDISMYHTYN